MLLYSSDYETEAMDILSWLSEDCLLWRRGFGLFLFIVDLMFYDFSSYSRTLLPFFLSFAGTLTSYSIFLFTVSKYAIMFSTSSVSNSFFALTKTLPKDSTVITPSGVQKCLNMFCVYLYFMILSPSFYFYLLTFFFFICKGWEETELDCWAFDACDYYWRRDSC